MNTYRDTDRKVSDDHLLTAVSPRLRELNQEIDALEWEGGSAPEKMQALLLERKTLMEAERKGELYVPCF